MNKIQINNNPSGVFFDMERNGFYRINKLTGQQYQSYKNGDAIRKFKPSITGLDYHIRRSIQPHHKGLRMPQLFKSKKSNNQSPKHQIIDKHQQSNQNNHIPQLKLNKQTQSLNRTQNNSPNSSFFYSVIPNQQNYTQSYNSITFRDTLKKFTQAKAYQTIDNHSPRKDTIPGSSPLKDYLETVCMTMRNLKNDSQCPQLLQMDIKHKQMGKKQRNYEYPNQLQLKQQKKRQNNIFLRFHPQYVQRQNKKNVQKQLVRKQNLKKLQKLFITTNNRFTNFKYSSP